jgi:hypothetical protein
MITRSEEITITTLEYDGDGHIIKETKKTTRTIEDPDKPKD